MDGIKPVEVKQRRSGRGKTLFFVVLLIIIFGAVGFYASRYNRQTFDAASFHAVFLENGQVYFGKVASMDRKEIVLKNVYYLQVADAAQDLNDAQARFNLVKLGSELHGPTDELFLNRERVLFYERLRPDSRVVESINNL